uniref:Ig-like domain-containing protein n=1 Tax=Myotis lucifugus TaxID=59463 RepID=G1P695_MYOLU
MESLSAPICRGPVPWQGLLLAVSLLNFWSLPTAAQLAIVSTNAAKGQDVTLRIRNMPPNPKGFTWYRGEGANYYHELASLGTVFGIYITGYANSGREQINYDGSLQLKQVTQKDTGIYTVVVYLPGSIKEIGFGRLNASPVRERDCVLENNTECWEHPDLPLSLTCPPQRKKTHLVWAMKECAARKNCSQLLSEEQVDLSTLNITSSNFESYHGPGPQPLSITHALYFSTEPVRVPTLIASNTIVTEHKDSVVLNCYTNAVSTQWFFNGMDLRLKERMKLSWNDRTLTIDPVRREDAGSYQCEVSNPISTAYSAPVELDVKY